MNAATWLKAWDSQGPHRTGTAGDHAGAEWLAGEAAASIGQAQGGQALGVHVNIEIFVLSRVDPVDAWVECDSGRIEGVPVYDSPSTPPEGVSAPLAVACFSPWAVYTPDYRAARRAVTHAGLVIVCQGSRPGLGLLNAEQFREPYGCPAIQIAETPATPPVRMVSFHQRTETEARNVVVTIPGRDRTLPPLVVMTPRSSWWNSTSERGGGIVCWLETLRALLAIQPLRDVVLTANSGHELGHLGLDAFQARRPGWEKPDGAIWVHYGANIGASGGVLSVQSADEPLREAMRRVLTAAGQPPDTMAPPDQVPNGETRDIHLAGGRYVTLAGSSPLFHLPEDRWPDAVDVPAIERVARGAAALVVELASR